MHCVSTYPMKIEDANLLTIKQLKKNIIVMLVIVVMKMECCIFSCYDWQYTLLERHITLDRTMYGSDQAASLSISRYEKSY